MLISPPEAVSSQTWGAPIFEERPVPAGASGSYPVYSVNLGTVCLSAGGAYFVYGIGNTAATMTETLLIEGRQPLTIAEVVPIQSHSASQLDRTIAALNQYRAATGESSLNPAADALQFLDALPKYLPSPKAARSDTGTITLFWNVDNFYADAEFLGDSKFSIFTRERVGNQTRDEVLEEEPIGQAGGTWLRTYLAPMFPRTLTAAA
jgi:hypothetical protein